MTTAREDSRRGLRGLLRRFTASEEELEAEALRAESAAKAGCQPAQLVHRGEMVTVTGRLRTVVYTPRTNLPTLEADLYDGSDVVTLVWLGRRQIAGIEPERAVTARGRVAVRDQRKVIYNRTTSSNRSRNPNEVIARSPRDAPTRDPPAGPARGCAGAGRSDPADLLEQVASQLGGESAAWSSRVCRCWRSCSPTSCGP
jgi:hypothetical protein